MFTPASGFFSVTGDYYTVQQNDVIFPGHECELQDSLTIFGLHNSLCKFPRPYSNFNCCNTPCSIWQGNLITAKYGQTQIAHNK